MIRRPVIRYPGGKYNLAKWVISHFPPHETYVELFGGAASVLMRKPRSAGEIYNDINGDVVNVFRVLRDREQAEVLKQQLILTPFAYQEYKDAYEKTDEPIERARRLIFRSFAGIGSDAVFRKNAGFRGLKNKQSGITAATEWARYPAEIIRFVERLQGVTIEHRDAFRLLDLYDRKETLFYADPPYLMETRSAKSVMYVDEFDENEHIRLAQVLKALRGKVIVSGYVSNLYEELYAGWKQVRRKSKAQNGLPRVECLWLSPNIRATLFDRLSQDHV